MVIAEERASCFPFSHPNCVLIQTNATAQDKSRQQKDQDNSISKLGDDLTLYIIKHQLLGFSRLSIQESGIYGTVEYSCHFMSVMKSVLKEKPGISLNRSRVVAVILYSVSSF